MGAQRWNRQRLPSNLQQGWSLPPVRVSGGLWDFLIFPCALPGPAFAVHPLACGSGSAGEQQRRVSLDNMDSGAQLPGSSPSSATPMLCAFRQVI